MSVFWLYDYHWYAIKMINYNNPLVILSAIGLFLYFKPYTLIRNLLTRLRNLHLQYT